MVFQLSGNPIIFSSTASLIWLLFFMYFCIIWVRERLK